jgi:hypothetical protein
VASLGSGHAGLQLPKSKRCVKDEKVGMRTTFVKAAIQLKLENVRSGQGDPLLQLC